VAARQCRRWRRNGRRTCKCHANCGHQQNNDTGKAKNPYTGCHEGAPWYNFGRRIVPQKRYDFYNKSNSFLKILPNSNPAGTFKSTPKERFETLQASSAGYRGGFRSNRSI